MSDDQEKQTEEQRVAESAVRGLGLPKANPDFRARLRQEFASGSIRPQLKLVPNLARGRGIGPWMGAFAAAAAALVLIAGWANQGPRWTVHRLEGAGTITVDDHNFPASQAEQISAALHPGAVLHLSEDATLDLNAGSTMVLELAPGSNVRLPGSPGRWWSRRVAAQVMAGNLRISTGQAFHGASLMVKGRDAEALVTGTTLTVICDDVGTCVCVREGRVDVRRPNSPMVSVPEGQLMFTPRDGAPSVCHGMRPDERIALDGLLARERSFLGR